MTGVKKVLVRSIDDLITGQVIALEPIEKGDLVVPVFSNQIKWSLDKPVLDEGLLDKILDDTNTDEDHHWVRTHKKEYLGRLVKVDE